MIPKDLLYTKSHEWIRVDDGEAVVGITHFAQEQLGDLTYVELPEVGQELAAGDEMGSVESVKAASEIYSPVSGEVLAVNEELDANPGIVNDDPYAEGWMVRIKLSGTPEGVMDAGEYQRVVDEEEH